MRVLAGRSPPSLQATGRFLRFREQESEETWFGELARKYLPGKAAQIMGVMVPWVRILRFAGEFGRRYFPLNTDYLEMMAGWHDEMLADDEEPDYTPYEILRNGIPYLLYGYSYEDFHEIFENESPFTCLSMLLTSTGGFYMMGDEEDAAAREVVREGLARTMSLECLRSLPENGFSPVLLRAALQGTPLEPMALQALWLTGETGNFFLDNQLDYEMEINYSERWDDETIQLAAGEWRDAQQIIQRVRSLSKWMERDFPQNARDAVEFLLERVETMPEHFRAAENSQTEEREE